MGADIGASGLQVRIGLIVSRVSADSSADAATAILRTENLTIRFGGLTALREVNFAVERGEIRAIIGPNGAGKSTFFNCLTGVLRPSSNMTANAFFSTQVVIRTFLPTMLRARTLTCLGWISS